MEAEVSKVFESGEEACHANTKVMPLEHVKNMNGQRCDMIELWYTTCYHVHVILVYLLIIRRRKKQGQNKLNLCRFRAYIGT